MKLFGFLLVLLLARGQVAAPQSLFHMGPANWDFSAFVQANEVRTGWLAAQDHAVNTTFTTAQATLLTLHLGQLGLNFPPSTVDVLPWASPPGAQPPAETPPARDESYAFIGAQSIVIGLRQQYLTYGTHISFLGGVLGVK